MGVGIFKMDTAQDTGRHNTVWSLTNGRVVEEV